MSARRLALTSITLGVVALAACGGNAGPADFADKAEDFIEGDLAESPGVGGLTFTDAECQEPASTDVGTAYTCVAVGSDGQTYNFDVTINAERSLQVTNFTPADPAAATTTTTSTTVAG